MTTENLLDTTRVCIKNVPPKFSEANLRSHLVSNAKMDLVITDCKILRRQDGVSRKLAFVGFKNEDMAKHVIQHFDKSFALTARLAVEPALAKGKNESYRPWSKHNAKSSSQDGKSDQTDNVFLPSIRNELPGAVSVDKKLERKKKDFIDAMAGGKDKASNLFWANDDAEIGNDTDHKDCAQSHEMQRHLSEDDNESRTFSSSVESDGESVDIMNAYTKEVSDMDFLRSKVLSTKENLSDDDDSDVYEDEATKKKSQSSNSIDSNSNDNDDEDTSVNASWDVNNHSQMNDSLNDIESNSEPLQSDRLFVRNLPFSTFEDDLRETFSRFGDVIECHIPVDDSNRNKGYAFVKFKSQEQAYSAKTALDGTAFQGRLLHILMAQGEKKSQEVHLEEKVSHKMKNEMLRQKNASNSTGWSSSFVRGDAVVDNLASRLGIEKGTILNVKDGLSSGSAAVRLAMGESHIIEENRSFFQNHGVNMDMLVSPRTSEDGSTKRSPTMILVKNLPFDTSLEEISRVFLSVGGDPPKVLLPPSKTIALAVYSKTVDAKRAFRKLAYKRFKHVPLYLEWAPLCNISSGASDRNDSPENKIAVSDIKLQQIDEDETETNPLGAVTLYVKNLNFSTTENRLKTFFQELVGGVRTCRIPMKTNAIKSGTKVNKSNIVKQSMGFGFVEFISAEAATKALKAKDLVIDGHILQLTISKSGSEIAAENSSVTPSTSERNSTKLIVRNVPFQATRLEILQLFSSFSQVKRVTLPKKYDGTHRGFAFVEFGGPQEAKNAKDALSQTHLYGRHLVLEWAEDENNIDNLREKAKRESSTISHPNKKIRF